MTKFAFYIYILLKDTVLRSNSKFFLFSRTLWVYIICPVLADIFYFKTYFKIQRVISHLSEEEQLEEWKHSMLLSDYIASDCYNIIYLSTWDLLYNYWHASVGAILDVAVWWSHIPEQYYIGVGLAIFNCVFFYCQHVCFLRQFENLIGPLTLPQSLYYKLWYVWTEDAANIFARRIYESIDRFYRVIGGANMQRPVDFYVKFIEDTITSELYPPMISLIFNSV